MKGEKSGTVLTTSGMSMGIPGRYSPTTGTAAKRGQEGGCSCTGSWPSSFDVDSGPRGVPYPLHRGRGKGGTVFLSSFNDNKIHIQDWRNPFPHFANRDPTRSQQCISCLRRSISPKGIGSRIRLAKNCTGVRNGMRSASPSSPAGEGSRTASLIGSWTSMPRA